MPIDSIGHVVLLLVGLVLADLPPSCLLHPKFTPVNTGTMYKLDLHVDPKEAAMIAHRRRVAEERKAHIFDPKLRKVGIFKEVMEEQIAEKAATARAEKDFDERAARELVRQEKIAIMLDQRQAQDLRSMRVAEAQYRQQHQTKESRREWDINDPLANRTSAPIRTGDVDERLGVSSLQVFEGEDLLSGERTKQQRQQMAEWTDVIREHKRSEADRHAHETRLWELRQKEQTQRASEMEHAHTSAYKQSVHAVGHYNLTESDRVAAERAAARAREEEDKIADLMATVNSPLLKEEFSSHVPNNNLTKRRIVVDRYKGMTPEELEQIRSTQLAQMEEARQRRASDSYSSTAHDDVALAASRQAILATRAHEREAKAQRHRIASDNAALAEAQISARKQMNASLSRGEIDESFFSQFQRDAR